MHARCISTVFVRVAIHGEVKEVGSHTAIIEKCVAFARRAITSDPFAGALNGTLRLVESIACHVAPSLPASGYWLVLAAVATLAAVAASSTVSLVGENLPPIGPAPAKIAPGPAGLFVFQRRSNV